MPPPLRTSLRARCELPRHRGRKLPHAHRLRPGSTTRRRSRVRRVDSTSRGSRRTSRARCTGRSASARSSRSFPASTIPSGSTTRTSTSTTTCATARCPRRGTCASSRGSWAASCPSSSIAGKPLWELWFIEGVEGGRFAIISKVHHCLADGIAGTDLVTSLLTTSPDEIPGARSAVAPAPRRALPGETACGRDHATGHAAPRRRARGGSRPLRAVCDPRDAARRGWRAFAGGGRGLRLRLSDAAERADRAAPALRLDRDRLRKGQGDPQAARREGERCRALRGGGSGPRLSWRSGGCGSKGSTSASWFR